MKTWRVPSVSIRQDGLHPRDREVLEDSHRFLKGGFRVQALGLRVLDFGFRVYRGYLDFV